MVHSRKLYRLSLMIIDSTLAFECSKRITYLCTHLSADASFKFTHHIYLNVREGGVAVGQEQQVSVAYSHPSITQSRLWAGQIAIVRVLQ